MDCDGRLGTDAVAAFLTEVTVPVRLGCTTPAGYPWMLSLWYRYRDGRLECATAADAAVVEYVEHEPSVSFEVSTNDPPYRGVRGRGTASVHEDGGMALLRTLLERYLGGTDTPLGRRLLAEDRDEVRIVLDVDRCYAWDFSERMAGDE